MDEKIVKDSQCLAKDLANDCISRQGVSAWLANRGYRGLANKVMDEDRFPSAQLKSYREGYQAGFNEGYQAGFKDAQLEQPWISCSERLPDRFGKMLVTFIPAAGTLWTRVIIANYSDLMGIAKPCFWIGNVGKNDFANITSHVVAWMPLPEPYKEDDHD